MKTIKRAMTTMNRMGKTRKMKTVAKMMKKVMKTRADVDYNEESDDDDEEDNVD